ncbi:MAG: hypothetical protein SF339_22365 [Blastocatellia bacterium]|nr:hypothetical protein [Blastocatellia bacterium]
MAVVKGVKEKVHLPLYDSIAVKPKEQLGKILSSNVLRFFQDVTGKTKLLTNMQASSLLPHWNTYEARALRVVISDLPAQFPDATTVEIELLATKPPTKPSETSTSRTVKLTNLSLRLFVDFKRQVEGLNGKPIFLNQDDLTALGLLLTTVPPSGTPAPIKLDASETVSIDRAALKDAEIGFEQKTPRITPTGEQIFPNDGFGTLIGKFVYNTVTTFFVGEKIMIQVPTWFFPAGAGPYSENGKVTTHGYPNPQATFRFAEPVTIDAQQNFRVEIEVPESEVLSDLQRLYGPLFIWVALDGYMTRDVQ